MLADPCKRVGEILVGVHAVQLAGAADGLQHGQVLADLEVPDEEVILATYRDDPQRAFGDVVVERDLGVVEELAQGFALVERELERLAERVFWGDGGRRAPFSELPLSLRRRRSRVGSPR